MLPAVEERVGSEARASVSPLPNLAQGRRRLRRRQRLEAQKSAEERAHSVLLPDNRRPTARAPFHPSERDGRSKRPSREHHDLDLSSDLLQVCVWELLVSHGFGPRLPGEADGWRPFPRLLSQQIETGRDEEAELLLLHDMEPIEIRETRLNEERDEQFGE